MPKIARQAGKFIYRLVRLIIATLLSGIVTGLRPRHAVNMLGPGPSAIIFIAADYLLEKRLHISVSLKTVATLAVLRL